MAYKVATLQTLSYSLTFPDNLSYVTGDHIIGNRSQIGDITNQPYDVARVLHYLSDGLSNAFQIKLMEVMLILCSSHYTQ